MNWKNEKRIKSCQKWGSNPRVRTQKILSLPPWTNSGILAESNVEVEIYKGGISVSRIVFEIG